jgi:transposase InsO family protein
LQNAGLVASMSRKGMPYDNAVMESASDFGNGEDFK